MSLFYKPGGPSIYNQTEWNKFQEARNEYREEQSACGRFPHMAICACEIDCSIAIKQISLFEVYNGIFMGPFQAAFKT